MALYKFKIQETWEITEEFEAESLKEAYDIAEEFQNNVDLDLSTAKFIEGNVYHIVE